MSGFTDTLPHIKRPPTNKAKLEERHSACRDGLSPASGLTSPPEEQIPGWRATFAQGVNIVAAKFRVEDNLDFFPKWYTLSWLGFVNSNGRQCKWPAPLVAPLARPSPFSAGVPAKVGKSKHSPAGCK